ncbi:tetratricopeptide repeat protein [bacterium]
MDDKDLKGTSFSKVDELIELGKFYFINQKFEQAKKEFKRVLKLEPKNIEAFYNLALAYEATNDNDLAKKYYEQVLELDIKHKLAKEHLHKIIGSE